MIGYTQRITYLKAHGIFESKQRICATVDLASGGTEVRSYLTDWGNANSAQVSIHSYPADPYPVLIKWELESYNRQETASSNTMTARLY